MNSSAAWEPITPQGVARFAHASVSRLWLVQVGFALLAAGVFTWFVLTDWFPLLNAGIRRLPNDGAITQGRLDWHGETPVLLGENRFLAFSIDLRHAGTIRSPAHLQIEFGRQAVRVFGLLGYVQWNYPAQYIIPFNRPQLEPWWGAWKPAIVAGLFVGGAISLMVMWWLLATLYTVPVRLLAFYVQRELTLGGCWRLAGAALMPGSLVMTATTLGYALGLLDVLHVLLLTMGHFAVGWLYAVLAVLFLAPVSKPENPFKKEDAPGR